MSPVCDGGAGDDRVGVSAELQPLGPSPLSSEHRQSGTRNLAKETAPGQG